MTFDEWIEHLHKTQRHPSTLEKAQWFAHDHLPPHLRETSKRCFELAVAMTLTVPDGPQLSLGLQHLIDAKDCFVRQMTTAVQ